AFFVLLFSMTRVETQRFREIVISYGDAFGPLFESKEGAADRKLPPIAAVPGDDLGYLSAVLKASFADSATLKVIEFRPNPQYLTLSLPVAALFAPESGAFADNAKAAVFDLAGVLSNLKNRVAVVGTSAMS